MERSSPALDDDLRRDSHPVGDLDAPLDPPRLLARHAPRLRLGIRPPDPNPIALALSTAVGGTATDARWGEEEEEDLLSQFFAAADSNISSTLFLFRLVLVAAVACIAGIPEEQALLRGLFLLTIPFRSWLVVASNPQTGLGDTVTLLLTVWNCDSGALVTGRLVGNRVSVIPPSLRTRLRRISPKKSVEGLLGGVAFGALTYRYLVPATWWLLEAYAPNLLLQLPHDENGIYRHCSLEPDHDKYYSWTTGLLLSLAAITGDLWESQMKRDYHAKDTSRLLPGHGGVLDRFDSSLLAVVLYHVLVLWQEKNR